ncbi:MAG: peptidylprolyl isomerase [Candidatus Thermoplasmatota archaeon]|nr:peptidylprolyl isomerase [Candidatus Thermoplasmatota archaeon]
MDTTLGVMALELYYEIMPITSTNFKNLADNNFFDGLVFHRVIEDFVIQGGGYYPNGTHKESPFGPIPLETYPDILHVDGAISMARTNDPNSATSQFFICDTAQPHLDGSYAAFGKIIDGFEVLRSIAAVETTTKYGLTNWPIDDIIINTIIVENW